MTASIELAGYLFTRIKQLGIDSVHGVPGDYNLRMLDFLEPNKLKWIGNANELNAGYAADGYARTRGFGALITTFGVGELSAINALAGAFTERAAVVHIVGTPPRESHESRLMIHHTLGDGDYRHFAQMAAHVTAAQTNLIHPTTAPDQIDQVLRQCILQSRPVYIELPVDMVDIPVSTERLQLDIRSTDSVLNGSGLDHQLEPAVAEILDKMQSAKQPVILVDMESRPLGLLDDIERLVQQTQWPTYTSSSARGLIDMTAANVCGVYEGQFSTDSTKQLFDQSDLVLFFGAHPSTTNSYLGTSTPKDEKTYSFTFSGIRHNRKTISRTSSRQVLRQILENLDTKQLPHSDRKIEPTSKPALDFSQTDPDQPIKQEKVWRLLANVLREGDILMGETGTPAYGVREMALPKHSRQFTCITWLSIGYMLPAAQGAALAQQELISAGQFNGIDKAQTVLCIGDGSLQMTVQELGTMIRLKLPVLVILINNDGYTIERCIHGIDQTYNDIAPWQYSKALELFGARPEAFLGTAQTYGELQQILDRPETIQGAGVRMIEIIMDKYDCPIGPLSSLLEAQKQREKKR